MTTSRLLMTACAVATLASTASVAGADQSLNFHNDMPFPAEMPVYTPRVVFMDLPAAPVASVYADLPFPAEIDAYVPIRHYADLPALYIDQTVDQAMLILD